MDDAALPLLVADIATVAPRVPGVVGEAATARRAADLWTAHTGRAHRLEMAQRIYELERVIPPRPVEGAMAIAAEGDRAVVARWLVDFNLEAQGQRVELAAMDAFAARWIAREGRTMYLWVVDGRPVSMAGAQGDTPNGIRVSAVYTPPEQRGRGYASALVAAVSQAQLDGGKRYCFLFTDLANPTSNKIYTAIGYRPVADMADHRFDPPA
jgi:predicted GNAT family acetyltransferase